MNEAMATWLVMFLAGLVVIVFFVLPAILVFRLVRMRREEFYCPWVNRNVAVQFVTLDGRRPIGVFSCTAFPDTTGVLCGMPCVTAGGAGSLSKEPKEHVLDLLNE